MKKAVVLFVTHCYRRPRRLPAWPYNLFAMVHGATRDEVQADVTKIADLLGAYEHKYISVDLSTFGGSALVDSSISVPTNGVIDCVIPITYVPARNTIMLSLAIAWAETLDCQDIFIGVNAVDYSGYPDCRPDYIAAFETMANLATRAVVEGKKMTLHAPLINLSKSEIIQAGVVLGVDYGATVSCYQADELGQACGQCDACRIRKAGFAAAGITDPTQYRF